jgi:hypothetical protein
MSANIARQNAAGERWRNYRRPSMRQRKRTSPRESRELFDEEDESGDHQETCHHGEPHRFREFAAALGVLSKSWAADEDQSSLAHGLSSLAITPYSDLERSRSLSY